MREKVESRSSGASNIRTSFFLLPTTCTLYGYVFEKCTADLDGQKYFNDDHREEFTDDVQLIPGFQECDEEDVETGIPCDAEDYGFQTLNNDEIVTSAQVEYDTVDDETDEDEGQNNTVSIKGPLNADAFSALETAME
ncbi:uncharacterized protein TNCV_5111 [Trichonephila clavipes]|nr:uncharacterized protein TNCV_5111 [Trichonephila clavipes]